MFVCAHAEYNIVHYERAYELIYHQLYHLREVPFKDIVFAIENAYLGDSADYNEYNREIERMVSALQRQADTYAHLEHTFHNCQYVDFDFSCGYCWTYNCNKERGTYDAMCRWKINTIHRGI